MDMRHINCTCGSLMDMRGSKTVRQLKLVCHPEVRRRGYGSGAEKGRKTVYRERRNVPWTGRRSNQSILKEINPEYSLEGLMLKLKLQYLGHILWCEEPTDWKRLWCWEKLKAGGEGDYRGWDGWMASLTKWTWIWVSLGSWWWTGKPGVLQSMGLQRGGHDWATELNNFPYSATWSEYSGTRFLHTRFYAWNGYTKI